MPRQKLKFGGKFAAHRAARKARQSEIEVESNSDSTAEVRKPKSALGTPGYSQPLEACGHLLHAVRLPTSKSSLSVYKENKACVQDGEQGVLRIGGVTVQCSGSHVDSFERSTRNPQARPPVCTCL